MHLRVQIINNKVGQNQLKSLFLQFKNKKWHLIFIGLDFVINNN